MRKNIEKAAQGVRDIKTGMLVPNPARHCGGKEERKTLLHTGTARITISLVDTVVVRAT